MWTRLLTAFTVNSALISALRIAQINDVHVDLNYKFDYCSFPVCLDNGNFFMDPPLKLVDTVIGDMKYWYHTSTTKIDAVLLAGDFVVHGLSNSDPDHKNWPAMKDVFNAVINEVQSKFPGVPIISSIGNNDLLNHYQAPS
jgi:Calcineurin-like phosphoesterase